MIKIAVSFTTFDSFRIALKMLNNTNKKNILTDILYKNFLLVDPEGEMGKKYPEFDLHVPEYDT